MVRLFWNFPFYIKEEFKLSENTNPATNQNVAPQGNGLAVTALVLGIIGLVIGWVPIIGWLIGPILALLAIIFGAVGARKPVKKGMAIAGLVMGIIIVALYVFSFLGLFSLGL